MSTSRKFLLLGLALTLGMWWWFERPLPAPPLELVDIEGERRWLAAYEGRPLLIYFWSPDCTVCMHEMPAIQELYVRLSKQIGLEIFGVATWNARPDRVLKAVHRMNVSYPVVLDPLGKVEQALGPVRVTPYMLLIDTEGRIVARKRGAQDLGHLEQRLRRLAAGA